VHEWLLLTELHISPRWISSFSCVAASFSSQKRYVQQRLRELQVHVGVSSLVVHRRFISSAVVRPHHQPIPIRDCDTDETILSIEDIQILVSPRSPSSQASTHKKATKGFVIVVAPEPQLLEVDTICFIPRAWVLDPEVTLFCSRFHSWFTIGSSAFLGMFKSRSWFLIRFLAEDWFWLTIGFHYCGNSVYIDVGYISLYIFLSCINTRSSVAQSPADLSPPKSPIVPLPEHLPEPETRPNRDPA
jgi:hypothetical protein